MSYPYEKRTRGHIWRRDEDGSLDIFAYNPRDPHNGPECIRCGYGFCHHCEVGPEQDCNEVIPHGFAGIPSSAPTSSPEATK